MKTPHRDPSVLCSRNETAIEAQVALLCNHVIKLPTLSVDNGVRRARDESFARASQFVHIGQAQAGSFSCRDRLLLIHCVSIAESVTTPPCRTLCAANVEVCISNVWPRVASCAASVVTQGAACAYAFQIERSDTVWSPATSRKCCRHACARRCTAFLSYL